MTAPHRVLVLFAHPAVQKSRLNVRLAAAACGLPGVTFHDLYETYPDFNIDVPAEQARLEAHEVIVLQHPFYWYSGPALLKEWLDQNLTQIVEARVQAEVERISRRRVY